MWLMMENQTNALEVHRFDDDNNDLYSIHWNYRHQKLHSFIARSNLMREFVWVEKPIEEAQWIMC